MTSDPVPFRSPPQPRYFVSHDPPCFIDLEQVIEMQPSSSSGDSRWCIAYRSFGEWSFVNSDISAALFSALVRYRQERQ